MAYFPVDAVYRTVSSGNQCPYQQITRLDLSHQRSDINWVPTQLEPWEHGRSSPIPRKGNKNIFRKYNSWLAFPCSWPSKGLPFSSSQIVLCSCPLCCPEIFVLLRAFGSHPGRIFCFLHFGCDWQHKPSANCLSSHTILYYQTFVQGDSFQSWSWRQMSVRLHRNINILRPQNYLFL